LLAFVLLMGNLLITSVASENADALGTTDEKIIAMALEIELNSSEAICKQKIESIKSVFPEYQGSFRDSSFLYGGYLPESSQQFLLYGVFDNQNRLKRYQISWAGIPNEQYEQRIRQMVEALTLSSGEAFRELEDVTFRETFSSKYEKVMRIYSWQTTQNGNNAFAHLSLQETNSEDSKTVSVIFTQEDIIPPNNETPDTEDSVIKSGKSTVFHKMESGLSLVFYFRDDEITTVTAVALYLDASKLFNDFNKSPFASTNIEAYYLAEHTMGVSFFLFDQVAGMTEIRYSSGIERIDVLNHGLYGDVRTKMLSLKNEGKVSDFIKVEEENFITKLVSVLEK